MTSYPTFFNPPSHVKGLIFDLDGTLADTMPWHLKSWRMLGEHFGVAIEDYMINELAGTPTPEVALLLNKKFGWSLDPDEVQHMKNVTYDQVKNSAGPVQPIETTYAFAKASRAAYPMTIGTGSTKANALTAVADMDVEDWFVTMVTADDVEYGKPHPETFLKCAEAMGLPPESCQLYEDGPSGIDAGLAAGMRVVHIVTGEIYTP